MRSSPGGSLRAARREIDRALRFMRPAASTRLGADAPRVDFYTSHEALVLGYEEALTRRDSLTGDFYDCSAHMGLDRGAHPWASTTPTSSSSRGVSNPVGVKVGPHRRPTRCWRCARPSTPIGFRAA